MPVKDPEKLRVRRVLRALRKEYPEPECALTHRTPFQLLVATILSAQCTDERVNMVTKELFPKLGTPEELAAVPQEVLEAEIKSTGFFRNKSKNLRGMAQKLVAEFDGEVPATMEELLSLPGVARKTANVVLGTAFGIAVGVVVDTHVIRLSNRLGLTEEKDPVKIERDLMAVIPKKDWVWFSHALIWHGRRVCNARKPRCEECGLARDCPSAGELG
ncbi:MAG: endonuclease III [Planctomycetota bacterium]|jgi:endonuclease-3